MTEGNFRDLGGNDAVSLELSESDIVMMEAAARAAESDSDPSADDDDA